MAKRSSVSSSSKRIETKEEVIKPEYSEPISEESSLEEEIPQPQAPEEPQVVGMILLKSMKLNYIGPVTGKLYVWGRAGDMVYVDKEDADIMRYKTSTRDCCSGTRATPYFEIIE